MTTKPMLSVELRKALADFIEYSVPGSYGIDEKWYSDKQALRALLDKQECSTCKGLGVVDDGELTHSAGGILYGCGPIKCVKDCPDCKPAAQHHGDPVCAQIRYRRPEKGCPDFGKWHDLKLSRFDKSRTSYIDNAGWACETRVLYAEQPAPVAVDAEILERFPEINFANYGQDEVEALQAWAFEAYEAIARLNGGEAMKKLKQKTRHVISAETISRGADLRKAGFSWNECAEMMGEKMQSLRSALDRNGVPAFGRRGSSGGSRKTPAEAVLRARELRAQGVCWKLVERELGISFNTLSTIIHRENKATSDGK